MADRRKKVKKGLEAVLRSTTEPEEESEEEAAEAEVPEEVGQRPMRRPRSYRRLSSSPSRTPRRHTSVYLHPVEFDMLDDMIYLMRKNHGLRVPKSDFWRALLYLASRMLDDPKRADELLEECARVRGE